MYSRGKFSKKQWISLFSKFPSFVCMREIRDCKSRGRQKKIRGDHGITLLSGHFWDSKDR